MIVMDDLFAKLDISEEFLIDVARKACLYRYAENLIETNVDYSIYDKSMDEYTIRVYDITTINEIIAEYKTLISNKDLSWNC
jgi:hypothetical protein